MAFNNPTIAAELAAKAAKVAQEMTSRPPVSPRAARVSLSPKQDTATFSKGAPKQEATPKPDPGDTLERKSPPPVPVRKPMAQQGSSSSLSSTVSTEAATPASLSPSPTFNVSALTEDEKIAWQCLGLKPARFWKQPEKNAPLKGRAAEEAFLAKWQDMYPGRELPAELQAIANRKLKIETDLARVDELTTQIKALEAEIAHPKNALRVAELTIQQAALAEERHNLKYQPVTALSSPRKSMFHRVASVVKRPGTPGTGKRSPEPDAFV